MWKVLLGGALAIIGGLAAQHYRGRQERRWAKERLVARIRSALETAAAVSRSAVKKDETREINPEVMREIILAWQRYDRVADEVHLLRTPQFEEVVDATLSQARMIAEKILEDERRFKVTARETGTMTKQGIDLDPGILAKMHVQRKALLQLLRDSGGRCEAVLERFNAKWRPARWHAPREAPPAMPHDSVGDTAASSPEHREVP